jgi:hypothetical protein
MDGPDERTSSPLLGRASDVTSLQDSDLSTASRSSRVHPAIHTSFEPDDPGDNEDRTGFKDIDDDLVQAEGEDQITAYIWILVCCASISGLMFGESSPAGSRREALTSVPGVDTAMSVFLSSSWLVLRSPQHFRYTCGHWR